MHSEPSISGPPSSFIPRGQIIPVAPLSLRPTQCLHPSEPPEISCPASSPLARRAPSPRSVSQRLVSLPARLSVSVECTLGPPSTCHLGDCVSRLRPFSPGTLASYLLSPGHSLSLGHSEPPKRGICFECSDFHPFSFHGTRALTTQVLQHAKKCIFYRCAGNTGIVVTHSHWRLLLRWLSLLYSTVERTEVRAPK